MVESRHVLGIGDRSLSIPLAELTAQVYPDELRFICIPVGLPNRTFRDARFDPPPFQFPSNALPPQSLVFSPEA